MTTRVKIGLEELLSYPDKYLKHKRVGLLANPTTVSPNLVHALDLLHADPQINLQLLFGPEHGLRGDAQDMINVADAKDSVTGLPEVSLYGTSFDSLSPKLSLLTQIDTLIIDMQDIGSRYYTYASTMALCMQKAKAAQIEVIVLDRPNPIGGIAIEGSGIESGLENFCGLFPIPQRHGLTLGELAHLYHDYFSCDCELTVIPCSNWHRRQYFEETSLPWVMPSPNMPTCDTAIVYPGMCLIEATNLSEGRGTTRPFELVGAPFIDGHALATALKVYNLPGVIFRPCVFRPTFHKHLNQTCGGVQLHVVCRDEFLSYKTGIAVIHCIKQLWPNEFAWRKEPYEFRTDVPAIDLLTGTGTIRELIDEGALFNTVWQKCYFGREVFDIARPKVLLYD